MSTHDKQLRMDAQADPHCRSERLASRAGKSPRFVARQPDPRVIAAMVLERVLVDSESAATVLPAVFRRFRPVEERYRKLATELVYTTLRMQKAVTAQLSAHTVGGLPNDSALLAYLLVAATEILHMDHDHSSGPEAIDVAVSQVEVLRGPRMAGIANGILSRVLASQTSIDQDSGAR